MVEIVTYIVDDEAQIRGSIIQLLELSGIKAQEVESAEAMLARISRDSPAVIVSDIRMPNMDGLELLARVNSMDPSLPVILITGHGDVAMAVEAMQLGAYDFLEKPFDPEVLISKIERASKSRSLTLDNRLLRSALSNPDRLKHVFVGVSPSIENIRSQILEFAQSDDHLLVRGENGSGRSLAARSIHAASSWAKHPIRTINCASYEEDELEAKIFDDASQGAPFQNPTPITVILDDIQALSPRLQARLASEIDKFDDSTHVRVIAIQTTNDNIRLADNLKYRLDGKTMNMPSLRERGSDILAIFNKYYQHFAQDYGNDPSEINANLAALMMTANWPGNVRQLIKLAERMAMLEDPSNMENILREELGDETGAKIEASSPLKVQVDAFEEMLIRNSLSRHNGSIASVLEELGLPRRTLNEKMTRYGLSRADFVT